MASFHAVLRSSEEGDWEELSINGAVVASGHSISTHDWLSALEALGCTTEHQEVPGEELL